MADTFPDVEMGTTYNLGTANREDLLDVITNISPTTTPFFSAVAHGTAYATLHEWPTDELTDAASNSHIEGFDPDFPALVDRTRLTNYCQIFANAYLVSETQDKVSKAGIDSEWSYQATKKMKEHARDIEYAIFNNNTSGSAGSSSSATQTARTLKGIGAFIDSNNTTNAANNGTTGKLTEDNLGEMMAGAWEDGGEIDHAFMNQADKRNITQFTSTTTRNIEASENKLINNIEVYESDFGMFRIVPSRYITKSGSPLVSTIYGVEIAHWGFDFLRNPKSVTLAKTGDSMKGMIVCEGTLVGRAPKANWTITNVQDL